MKIGIQGLTFCYRSMPSLVNISLTLENPEILGLIGPNGSGKTTLLKCLNKILEPKQGSIMLDGTDIRMMSRIDVAKCIGYVPQTSVTSPSPIRVFDIVFMGRRPHISWKGSQKDVDKVWEALRALNIEHLALRDFYELSGGEQQKVLIARSLAQEAKVLLLDEPTSNLDIKHQLEVMELTRSLVRQEKIVAVVAIHDLNLAARFCDKIVMMKNGAIFAAGEACAVITPENIRAVYGVEVEVSRSNSIPYIIPIQSIAS